MIYALRPIFLTCLLALSGCNTPGTEYRGIDPVRVSLGGSTFDIRVDGTRAQAMRVNMQWAPRLDAVAPQAVAAIEKVSGCRVRRLDGDAALMTARLDCGQKLAPLPQGGQYDCDAYRIGDGLAELECTRVLP